MIEEARKPLEEKSETEQIPMESEKKSECPEKKSIKRRVEFRHVALALSFFVPFLLMIAIFIGNEIFPFGKRCFLFSDMYHQYMPFFQELVNKIKAGEGIDYSWNVGMGSNFLALYVYYLASPFNWLEFLFPAKYLIEFMSYMVVIKIGLSGLTSFLYFRSKESFAKSVNLCYGALLCSTFYAMSGFVAAYNWNVMWMDCVVLFPLIMLGLEKLVREGKMGIYVFSLALSIFTNFYLSIMICLFLVLYFIYLFLAEKRSFSMVWKFALGSLMAGGLAAVLLIPEVRALMATDFGKMEFPKKWESYFPIIDVIARHGMAVTTERALEHWPNIYCGCMVFFMVPLYAMNEEIPARKRLGLLTLAGIFLISFSTNGLDFIWHGLNYPDSLPARQSFIYVLLILVLCYECFAHLEGVSKGLIVKAYLGSVAFFLVIEKFVDVSDFLTWTWLLNLGMVTIYAACLYLYKAKDGRTLRYVVGCIAFVAMLGETAGNMAYTSVGTVDRAEYLKNVQDYHELYERNVLAKEGFSRAEKFTRKTKNDAVLAGFPSASVFSSTMNSRVMDFYTKIGLQHSKVFYGFDGATPFVSALLNVGYMFGDSEDWENRCYRQIDGQNGVYLYESLYTLPFGYVAPKGFDLPNGVNDRGVNLQNKLALDLGARSTMLVSARSEADGDDVSFTASEPGVYYGYVNKSGTSKIKMTSSFFQDRSYKDLKYGTFFYVGYVGEGEEITLTNGDDKDTTPKISVAMYRLNVDALREALETLGKQHMTDVKVEDTHVSGKLELSEAGRLVLSIPADDGWTTWVNGEETETTTFGGAFIALDLEPGNYEIELRYEPVGKKMGFVVTCVSAVFAALFFGLSKWRRKKKK